MSYSTNTGIATPANTFNWDSATGYTAIQSYQYQQGYLTGTSGSLSWNGANSNSYKGIYIRNNNAVVIDLPFNVAPATISNQTRGVRQSQSAFWTFRNTRVTQLTTYNPYQDSCLLQRVKVV